MGGGVGGEFEGEGEEGYVEEDGHFLRELFEVEAGGEVEEAGGVVEGLQAGGQVDEVVVGGSVLQLLGGEGGHLELHALEEKGGGGDEETG